MPHRIYVCIHTEENTCTQEYTLYVHLVCLLYTVFISMASSSRAPCVSLVHSLYRHGLILTCTLQADTHAFFGRLEAACAAR